MKLFFSLDKALLYRPKGVRFPFIVAQECNETFLIDQVAHTRKRQFLAFNSIQDYLSNFDKYPHCHELIIPHGKGLMSTVQGRLVFDFDLHIPESKLPTTFHTDVENLVCSIFSLHYQKVDTKKFQFIWILCKNPSKISQHLIVKNAFFVQDWIRQSREFYLLFSHEASHSSHFSWISPKELVDHQVARTSASLRMPLNSKIGGNPLFFRDENVSFYDGLVCVYRGEDKLKEQTITCNNLVTKIADLLPQLERMVSNNEFRQMEDETAKQAFETFCQFENKNMTFLMGKVFGPFVNLIRQKSAPCHMDITHVHEGDNAYLCVLPDATIYFYCRRGCCFKGKKFRRIGKNNIPDHMQETRIPKWI